MEEYAAWQVFLSPLSLCGMSLAMTVPRPRGRLGVDSSALFTFLSL